MTRRLTVSGLWLGALLLCLWLALFRTPVATDITLFIPRADSTAEALLQGLQSGPAARLLLLALEGGSEQARALSSERLAERLRQTGLFIRVANGREVIDPAEQSRLFGYRYLLSPTLSQERFSPAGLRAALEQRLQALGGSLSPLEKRLLPADPTAEFLALARLWSGGQRQPERRLGVWFSAGGRRALLLAESTASPYDPEAQDRVLAAVREGFAAIRADRGVALRVSGPAVMAVHSRDTIRAQVQALGAAATVLTVGLLWLAYRSLGPVLLSTLPLLSAVLAGTAVVGVLFGGIYGITLGFGMTLLGVAADYPIHLFSHLSSGETVEQTLQRIWPTLWLVVLTAALGYSAMLSAGFTGLAQLGVFAMAGLLAAAACVRWLLPALLPARWAPPYTPRPSAWMDWLLRPHPRLARAAGGLGGLALAALLVVAPPVWNDDLAALSPVPAELIALDRELRADLGAPDAVQMVVISAPHAETALRTSEALAQHLEHQVESGVLGGFEAPSRYLPSRNTQRQRQLWLPERPILERNLAQALKGLPFKPGLFQPFVDAVSAARAAPPLTPEDLAGTALGLRVGALLFPGRQDGWIALLPLSGVRDTEALMQGLAPWRGQGARYLNSKAEADRLVAGFRQAAFTRLAWGSVLIVLVLWWGLRDGRRVARALLPVVLATALTVVLLLLLGRRLSLFHLVSLLLVVGLNIDYSLFFSRPESDPAERRRTLHAVLLCSGSTLAVFGMLALSTIPVLQAIGQTVAIGVLLSFWLALLLARPVTHAV